MTPADDRLDVWLDRLIADGWQASRTDIPVFMGIDGERHMVRTDMMRDENVLEHLQRKLGDRKEEVVVVLYELLPPTKELSSDRLRYTYFFYTPVVK